MSDAPYTLAIDGMGGDNAPDIVVEGIAVAAERHPGARFLLFGDEAKLAPLLRRYARAAASCTVRHTPDVIGNDMKATAALRVRHASMRLAIDAVAAGEASGVVSAGNTGALLALSKIVIKTLPGIDRPAMAAIGPSARGDVVMLDLGANVLCDVRNLVEFAVMGDVFARTVLGLTAPTIGLLNVGTEETKGDDQLRQAADVLRMSHIGPQFHGFVEGHDIAAGTTDVIVTDGFTGNVALKTGEGALRLVGQLLRQVFSSSLGSRLGYLLARPGLRAAARVARPTALQRGGDGRPERRGGEIARRHRRAGLRPCGRCRDGHGGTPLQRPYPRGPGAHRGRPQERSGRAGARRRPGVTGVARPSCGR